MNWTKANHLSIRLGPFLFSDKGDDVNKHKPMFFRILYPDHTKKYAGTIADVEEITGMKITDPENFEGGGIGNILIEPIYEGNKKRITAHDRANIFDKIYGGKG